ncbi:MAG: hypothetical protein JW839_13840, partial [Candidatus Lokiarchaeota archaeon]|nr:hypothetical protein [Candidatus Lokiarchaeota archaeon]
MGDQMRDFTGRKVVFVDWTNVHPGYGIKPRAWADPGTPGELVPRGIDLVALPGRVNPEPCFAASAEWENFYIAAYSTVLVEGGKLRLYYECYLADDRYPDNRRYSLLCYAESTDAASWYRPDLGLVDFRGSTRNNILIGPSQSENWRGPHGAHVFVDPHAPASERYKLTFEGPGNMPRGASSADGIRWVVREQPIINAEADSQDVVEWDPTLGKYVGYFRVWRQGRRGIARGESDDFWHWPDPEIVLHAEAVLDPDADYYTNAYHAWPGTEAQHDAFVMLPAMYHRTSDKIDAWLYTSKDGRHWHRPGGRAFASLGDALYVGRGIWQLQPGEWNVLASVYTFTHNAWPLVEKHRKQRVGGLYRVRFREDGFTGIRAAGAGEFWTASFTCRSASVVVNAVTLPGGWIRVGLHDARFNVPIEGFEASDCDAMSG